VSATTYPDESDTFSSVSDSHFFQDKKAEQRRLKAVDYFRNFRKPD
jgi:hypothetical protein